MNLDTLESRLLNYIKRSPMSNHNQQYPQLVSSSPVGTMIPTPGMSHLNSSMVVTSSVDASMNAGGGCNNIASQSVNNGGMFLTGSLQGNSLSRHDGNTIFYTSSLNLST